MGVVYRAYDSITKRPVAVKTMWGDLEPGALELFEREWTVLARLSHPNIVDILDTGEFQENGQRKPYFVMPLLPGKTLDQIIKTESQRLTVDRVVEIMRQACRGLQAAHDQNLVHRDLKPSNIFVMDDDTAKIIDFGVAHLADSRSVTGIKGTLQYMAPEQADMSSPVSPRSDIFSLAVVCYEALTGRKPFARRTEGDTIDAIRTHIPPPASEINGAVNNLLARTVHKAMAKQPWHRFSSAKEFADTLQSALRNEPIERFDPARIQPRIERVKKAYSDGDNKFAMEILSELESEGHIDPDMPVLRMQIEQSVRQREIRSLLEDARKRMESDEHLLALQKLGEILALEPNNGDALAMRAQIERQRSEKQIEGWFRLAEEHRKSQLFSQARQSLQEILNIDSTNTRARTMMAEIDQTEQDLARFREEKRRLYEGALASYRSGEISTALSKLERGLDLGRRADGRALTTEIDAQYQSFYNQVRSERDAAKNAYAEGRKCLEDKNTMRALEICEEYLTKQPEDPMFQALKLEAQDMERQVRSAAIAEMKRRAEAEPDLDKKVNLLTEACARFPDEPQFNADLKAVQGKRDFVNGIVAKARQYEERGQFAEATNQWDVLRNIHAAYPGLQFELERLARQREDHAHAEAKANWMERIDAHFANGEYARARDVIQEALTNFPNDQELEGLSSLAEQGIRRSAEAGVLLQQGQKLCEAKNYTDGLAALRQAERLDPRNTDILKTLLGGLVEYSRDLITKDWHAAEPLIQEAVALNAADPVVRSLSSLLESNKRQEAINTILVEARGLQAADDIAGALKKVEDGLAEYPNEVRLSQLHNTLRAAAARPEPGAATIVAPLQGRKQEEAAQPFSATSYQAAPVVPVVEPVIEKAVPPSVPPAVPPVKPVSPPPATDGPKKPIWLLAAVAAAVVLIGGSLLYTFLFKNKGGDKNTDGGAVPVVAGVKVTLTANQPGATFKVDGTPVAASTTLKPGEHTGEADLDGYSPDIHPFTVKNSATTVAFSLTPALPQLLFSSGLESGRLILDDAAPVDLQEGSFSKTDIPLGSHKVRVVDARGEVLSFSFDAEPKQMIKLTSPLTVRAGGSGVAVSSLAGAAQIYGTAGLKGGLAGQPAAVIPPEGLTVAATNPPQHVSVADGAKMREISPDVSPMPILTVMLNGGTERVTVNITANVPDGTVSVDGVELKRKMANGTRFVSLGPGTFSILVSHDGYQPATPQTLVIKPGDSGKHLEFTLVPVPRMASLEVTGAPAEAAVFLDDVRAGTVNAAGSFSKEVSPGSHQIVIRKAGLEDFKAAREYKAGETAHIAVQMHAVSASLALHVTPANAKITVRHETEIYTPQNGQSATLPPGNYLLTATADDYKTRSENIVVEAGKPLSIDWVLQQAPKTATDSGPSIPFSNPKDWTPENGWIVHSGEGISVYTGAPGTHTVDFQKRKGKMGFGVKKIVFRADFTGEGNYTQYSLDGRTLVKTVVVDGKAGEAQKLQFGQENGDVIRMSVELSPTSFVIKNRAGAVIDSIKKSSMGRFAFVGDVMLHITP
jgi:serine/threonine-protein kinase